MVKNHLLLGLLFCCQLTLAQTFFQQDTLLGIQGQYSTGSSLGGGLSFADFNQDGYDDLTFCSEQGAPLYFFENKIDHFEAVSFLGINNLFNARQAVWIDIENDGDKDLFVTAYGSPNLLYINDGNFVFTEMTSLMGLTISNSNSNGVNFVDINNDGFLDIYISNHWASNEVYLYDPNNNQYQNITFSSGANNGSQFTFCTTFFDYDFDGDLDFYLSNDGYSHLNALYQNNGNSTFTDIGAATGSDLAIQSMNTGIADYNNDGFWDIYCTDFGSTPSNLLQGSASGNFTEVALAANVPFQRFGWAANFADFDNDAFQDLYVCGTFVNANAPNALYLNKQDGTFFEPFRNSQGIANSDTISGYSNAIGDFNNDGKLDIALCGQNSTPFRLFTNVEENTNTFIKLKLKGVQSNIEGIGAVVEVWNNNSKRIFQSHCSNGFLNQNSSTFHIGFENQMQVDSIVISWPFGNNKDCILGSDLVQNQLHHIEEQNGIIDIQDLSICKNSLDVVINPIPSQNYLSVDLTESQSTIESGYEVLFQSESTIELHPGFEVQLGADFTAQIGICNQ